MTLKTYGIIGAVIAVVGLFGNLLLLMDDSDVVGFIMGLIVFGFFMALSIKALQVEE